MGPTGSGKSTVSFPYMKYLYFFDQLYDSSSNMPPVRTAKPLATAFNLAQQRFEPSESTILSTVVLLR